MVVFLIVQNLTRLLTKNQNVQEFKGKVIAGMFVFEKHLLLIRQSINKITIEFGEVGIHSKTAEVKFAGCGKVKIMR